MAGGIQVVEDVDGHLMITLLEGAHCAIDARLNAGRIELGIGSPRSALW